MNVKAVVGAAPTLVGICDMECILDTVPST